MGHRLLGPPTGLTGVSGFVTREIREATAGAAAAIFMSSGRLVLDHEVLKEPVASGAGFCHNRYVRPDRNYDYVDCGSDAQGQDVTDNTLSFGVSVDL